MDFSREDQAPEQLLNQAIWKSVKDAGSQMPAPRLGSSRAEADGDRD
jgi:hypothetical protein